MIKHFCDYCEKEIDCKFYRNTYKVKYRTGTKGAIEAKIALSTIVKEGVIDPFL